MNKLRNEASRFFSLFRFYKIEAVLSFAGLVLASMIFQYVDGISLAAWSLDTIDSFFIGGISGYKDILSQNIWGAPHGANPSPLSVSNIVFAIWNLPALLLNKLFRAETILTFPMLMWCNLLWIIIVFLCGLFCLLTVKKLTGNDKRANLAAILFWGSSTVMISVGYSMQNEVFYILFLLMGIYFSVCGRDKAAIICMMIACYDFPVSLVFAVLTVLSLSNNIVEIIKRIIPLLLASCLTFVVNSDNSAGTAMVSWYFDRTLLGFGNSGVSVFAVLIVIVYLIQLFKKRESRESEIRFMLYSLAVIAVGMCSFSWLHFYRYFTCVPFIILILCTVDSDHTLNGGLLSFLIFEVFHTAIACMDVNCFNFAYTFPWLRELKGTDAMPFTSLFGYVCTYFPFIAQAMSIVGGIAFGSAIVLLYLTYPPRKAVEECNIPNKLISVLWCAVPLCIVCVFIFAFFHISAI